MSVSVPAKLVIQNTGLAIVSSQTYIMPYLDSKVNSSLSLDGPKHHGE